MSVENLQLYKSIKSGRRSPRHCEESVNSPLKNTISEKSMSKSEKTQESAKSVHQNDFELQNDQLSLPVDAISEKSDMSLQRANSK